jgi:hypothetical protein
MIVMHHVPKIQYFRQIKMIKQINWDKRYDMVSICSNCYEIYSSKIYIKDIILKR